MESSLVDKLKLYAHRRVIGFSRQEGQELFRRYDKRSRLELGFHEPCRRVWVR